MTKLPLGTYRHYKGSLYTLLGVAKHSETGEKMVTYQAQYAIPELAEEYGKQPVFVRPYELFIDTIMIDGEKRPRFVHMK